MRLIQNKKGDKYLSPYWFAILVIVAGGIFGMVYIFYGTPYDIRQIEASVLINQIADCVSYAGKIDANLISNGTVQFQKTGTDFLNACHLNFNSIEWKEPQYYTEINFYKIGNLDNSVLDIKAGNNNLLSYCNIQENKEPNKLPPCVKKSFYSVDNANNQYIIKILTEVNKAEKNVKI